MERKRNLKNMIMGKLLKKEFMIGMEKEGNGHIMMMTMGLIALIAGVKLKDWWDSRA